MWRDKSILLMCKRAKNQINLADEAALLYYLRIIIQFSHRNLHGGNLNPPSSLILWCCYIHQDIIMSRKQKPRKMKLLVIYLVMNNEIFQRVFELKAPKCNIYWSLNWGKILPGNKLILLTRLFGHASNMNKTAYNSVVKLTWWRSEVTDLLNCWWSYLI